MQVARKHLNDFSILTGRDYIPNWHHEIIASELEHIEQFADRDYKILIVEVPPRHGKSQECTIDFPAWYLGKKSSREVIVSSYSGELAVEFGGKTKDKVSGSQYKNIFPTVSLREDARAKGRWMTKEDGGYTAVGVGGSITGRGADVFVIDDPVKNREEAESEVMQKKCWDWFTSTAWTRLSPHGVVFIIMTRWHRYDLVGRLLDDKDLAPLCKVIRFPAIAEEDESCRKAGEALWPVRYNLDALKKTRLLVGAYDFASLYQQTPILSEFQEFKPHYFKKRTQSEVDRLRTRKFLTIDTALSKKASADYTGICENFVDSENFWNFRAWRVRMSPKELIDFLFTRHETMRYERIGIEKTIYYDAIRPFLDEEMRMRDKFLPIVPLEHKEISKEVRVRGLLPRYEAGAVFHIEGTCNDLEDELVTFPQGAHDDVADAAAYQLQIVNFQKQDVQRQVSPPPDSPYDGTIPVTQPRKSLMEEQMELLAKK